MSTPIGGPEARPSRKGALAVSGALLAALLPAAAALGDPRGSGPAFFALLLAASAAHLAATIFAWHFRPTRGGAAAIVLVAAAIRAPFLLAPPSLSDDVWRYVWEGRVQAAGFDPYRLAPNSPDLSALGAGFEDVLGRVNNPEIPAVYPPGHELVLRAVAELGGGETALRILAALADLATGFVVAAILGSRGLPVGRAVAHLWCPLAAVEFAGSGHGDSLFLLALVLAVYCAERGRRALAAVALGASIALRAVPLVLVPVFARALRSRLVLAAAAVLLTLVPFAGGGPEENSPLAGARQYAKRWRYNDSAFRALLSVSEARLEAIESSGPQWMKSRVENNRHDFNPLAGAKTLALFLLGTVVAAVVALRRDLAASVLVILFAVLLLSPTVHPWYVAWLAPFAALVKRPAPALLFVSAAILAYHAPFAARPGEPWGESGAVVLAEYAPVYGAIAWEAVRFGTGSPPRARPTKFRWITERRPT